MRNIRKEEEITVSYLDENDLLSDDRDSLIQRKYGFDCRCDTCHQDDKQYNKSQRNRFDIATVFERWQTMPIDEWFATWMTAAQNRTRTLRKMDQVMELILAEELMIFKPRLLEYRFMVHAAWGDLSSARRVATQWEAAEKITRKGAEPPDPLILAIRQDPKKWDQWGKLSKKPQSVCSRINFE